jgi:vacuolar protein sorting-associated protein VTA1
MSTEHSSSQQQFYLPPQTQMQSQPPLPQQVTTQYSTPQPFSSAPQFTPTPQPASQVPHHYTQPSPAQQPYLSAPVSQAPVHPPAAVAAPVQSASSSSIAASRDSIAKFGQAQKLCKFAISALDYGDVTTATNKLREALQLLSM